MDIKHLKSFLTIVQEGQILQSICVNSESQSR